MDDELEECTRCGWKLYHLRRGICPWCESDLVGGGGKVEFSNYAAHAASETPLSVRLMTKRLHHYHVRSQQAKERATADRIEKLEETVRMLQAKLKELPLQPEINPGGN